MIKGILFKYYSLINNKIAYNNINTRTLEYRNKVNKEILEEGYELREKILQLADEFSARFELNKLHRRQKF